MAAAAATPPARTAPPPLAAGCWQPAGMCACARPQDEHELELPCDDSPSSRGDDSSWATRPGTVRLSSPPEVASPAKSMPLIRGVEKLKAALLDSTAAQRKTVYTRVRHGLKKQMSKDPDMWSWFQQLLLDAFDGLWDDVEDEVEHLLERGFFKQREEERQPPPDSAPLVARARAFLLHHYFPGDRSFFGKLKDPVWLMIAACTLLPVHGLRVFFFMVLLLCLVLPGVPDEYQLLNYILVLKGTQFFHGLLLSWFGAWEYWRCATWHWHDIAPCLQQHGPGADSLVGMAVDQLGAVGLVWLAFLKLRTCTRLSKGDYIARSPSVATPSGPPVRAGGRVKGLLLYDFKCFWRVACVFWALSALTYLTSSSPGGFFGRQFRTNLFWCSVLYSLSTVPFIFFNIFFLRQVLTHSTPTGYDEHGDIVRYVLGSQPRKFGVANVGEPVAEPAKDDDAWQADPSPARRLWKNKVRDVLQALQDARQGDDSTSERLDALVGVRCWASSASSPGILFSCRQPAARGLSGELRASDLLMEPLLEEAWADHDAQQEYLRRWESSAGWAAEGPGAGPPARARPAAERGCSGTAPRGARGHEGEGTEARLLPEDTGTRLLLEEPPAPLARGGGAVPSAASIAARSAGARAEPELLPGPRVRWMWADAGVGRLGNLHALTELNPARWSRLRPAQEAAAQLRLLDDGRERPVQVRTEGLGPSRTFASARLAAEWLHEQGAPGAARPPLPGRVQAERLFGEACTPPARPAFVHL